MDYTIKIEDKGTYLFCSVDGEDSFEVSLDYWTKISEECRRRKQKNVLVVENLSGTIGTSEIFKLNELLPEKLLGLKIAFVDLVDDHHEDNVFGQNCGRNRGAKFFLFNNVDTALKWLLDENVVY